MKKKTDKTETTLVPSSTSSESPKRELSTHAKIKAATQIVVKAAKELHTAIKLEKLAVDQSAKLHTKAARRLIRAREKHYSAVEALLKLEASKVSVKALAGKAGAGNEGDNSVGE